jgi:pimeloyl-ACP methyl ester carboxylesterase
MSAIIIDGSMVHYEALGRGRPIVFLHGWVGSWRYWISAMQVASTSFRAYAIDLFGFGDTPRDLSRYSLERQSDLINRFLSEMGIGKVALVGHDLGALVGFHYVQQYPKSVDRMMAINCPLDYSQINTRMRTASPAELVDWLSVRTPEATSALSDAAKADPQAIATSMAGLQAHNIFTNVRNLGVPCLFVHGSSNPAISILPPDKFDDMLPMHMHQVTLDGVGHFPMVENPSQFNRLMTDFLALESGISPRELQMKEEWKRRVR